MHLILYLVLLLHLPYIKVKHHMVDVENKQEYFLFLQVFIFKIKMNQLQFQ